MRFRQTRRVLTLLTVLLVAVASASAVARSGGGRGHSGGHHSSGAHTGGHHFGGPRVGFGVIVAGPAFWYYPPPYYPPDAVMPYAPPVYIEQDNALSAPVLPAGYWYYCADAQAYYPNVKECAETWQPVAPQGPAGQ